MAMNGNTLGTAIVTAVNALSSADKADPTKCWQAIAGAIVAHIQSSATVVIKSAAGYDGLQRDQTDGIATIRPVADVTLPGGTIQ